MLTPLVIGCDPSISHFGAAALEVMPGRLWTVRGTAVLDCPKLSKKRRSRESDEQTRRISAIARWLREFIASFRDCNVLGIAVESGAMPYRNGSPLFTPTTMVALGRARGLVDGIATVLDIPVIDVLPQEIKEMATGQRKGKKVDVRTFLERVYREAPSLWPAKEAQVEHAADALAAATVAARGEFIKGLLKCIPLGARFHGTGYTA
jgi:Holliday junction resolvasome RuvABC endonuclease subunit